MATVPKQVAFSSSLSNPRMSLSPAISLPCCRKISAFPVFRSSRLIASPVRSLSSLDSRTRRVLRRVGHIGSDAQETSADVKGKSYNHMPISERNYFANNGREFNVEHTFRLASLQALDYQKTLTDSKTSANGLKEWLAVVGCA